MLGIIGDNYDYSIEKPGNNTEKGKKLYKKIVSEYSDEVKNKIKKRNEREKNDVDFATSITAPKSYLQKINQGKR